MNVTKTMTTYSTNNTNNEYDTSGPKDKSSLSDYEQTRARNIERNNARLRSLGLISIDEERRSNAAAWGCSKGGRAKSRGNLTSEDDDAGDNVSSLDEEYNECEGDTSKKRNKRVRSSLPPREGSRKSRRLMNLPTYAPGGRPEDSESPMGTPAHFEERIRKEREALVAECREARQRAALEVAKAGVELAGKENPTATYEHCLMRVRSMTEKGLINRVSAFPNRFL